MKKRSQPARAAGTLIVSVLAIIAAQAASAAAAGSAHSASARIEPYLIASQQQEIALARTAAPPSVSKHAAVMVLGPHGYVTAAKGTNGFVCLVVRSWDMPVSVKRARFWNPKFLVPYCDNAAAAQSVLPEYLLKTRWALAGASKAQIARRDEAAWSAGKLQEPAAGTLCFMMSKRSWGVGGNPGPWRPHLMFYFANAQTPEWGANLGGNPVFGSVRKHNTVLMVLVPVWSDGAPAPSF